MELRHFRYFLAVAEHQHFAQAAESLGISPPSLTVQIKDLERHVGTQLFVRGRQGASLTPAGAVFLPAAEAAVAEFDRAVATGRRASRGEVGRLAIGYVGSAVFAGVLQPQLDRFRAGHPDVQVIAREFPMDQIVPMVETGDLDVGYVRGPVQIGPTLASHSVLDDSFCVALPSAHPLVAARGPVNPRDLAGELFVLPEQPLGTYEVARRGRFSPRVRQTPGGLAAVLAEVSIGIGVSVIPNVLTRVFAIPGVRFKPIAGKPVSTGIAAVYRRRESYPVAEAFIKVLKQSPPMVIAGIGKYAR